MAYASIACSGSLPAAPGTANPPPVTTFPPPDDVEETTGAPPNPLGGGAFPRIGEETTMSERM
eukprot:1373874-Amorphochlora_amoeboformis.AAC.1